MTSKLVFLAVSAALTGCMSNTQPGASVPASQTAASGVAAWDASYGGVDKSYDTKLLELRSAVAPKFKSMSFRDTVTGRTMDYNLYVPDGYKAGKSYPLVMFIADSSTVGKGVKAPLMQGYGGIVWATDESQARHPAFVLVPSFSGPQSATDDNWQVSEEVGVADRLLKKIISDYGIDTQRLYATGQSMGGMVSFYLNATEPDLFAASLFVGSQWDAKALAPLANDRFLYIVSAADPKASVGMRELGALLASLGAKYGEAEFAANLPQAEQDALAEQLLEKGLPINFIRFTPGTVAPQAYQAKSMGFEHMYSFDHAYLLEPARDWLFRQSRAKH